MGKSNIGERKTVPASPYFHKKTSYVPQRSFFCGSSGYWSACRESFYIYCLPSSTNVIYYGSRQIESLSRMFVWVESVLNIRAKSIIHPTDMDGCVAITISPFWKSCRVRFSLVTILIKAANNHPDLLPLGSLLNVWYAGKTRWALRQFLQGYTTRTDAIYGWVSSFSSGTSAKSLVVPTSDLQLFIDKKPVSKLTKFERDVLDQWVEAWDTGGDRQKIFDKLKLEK